jgi:hypothetical protein
MCYEFMKGVTYKEEDGIFFVEPYLFSIGTITLLEWLPKEFS